MSTASQIEAQQPISTTEKSDNLASEFLDIPPCTIEDVDRALFNLFDRQLPLLYTHRNDTRRVPIVFATGERFALIARRKPLRDRSKALILPVISILRSNLTFGSEIGMATAPDIRHVIKKQLGKEDPVYQRMINKLGLQNSDDLVSEAAFIDADGQIGAQPGRVATRRPGAGKSDTNRLGSGNLLDPNLGSNIYEIYEMPAPRYFMATYEVTIWTQYTQEMNNLLAVIATENNFNAMPSYRIETEKGYYFVAYFDTSVSNGSNFEDFSEEERLVRASLTVKVPGYFLGSPYKGAPNKIRRYVSAPQVSFDVQFASEPTQSRRGIPSGKSDHYTLGDLLTVDDPQIGQFVEGPGLLVNQKDETSTIGGYSPPTSAAPQPAMAVISSPFSDGKTSTSINVSKVATNKQGETTYRKIS